jgi:plasmid stabilization system protein ParE
MHHVVWLETASRDLDEILGYIEVRNVLAAQCACRIEFARID